MDRRGRRLSSEVERAAAEGKATTAPGGAHAVEHIEGDGAAIFEEVCRMGLEGIVSKRTDSIYRAGQSRAWVKVKNREHPAYMRVVEAMR